MSNIVTILYTPSYFEYTLMEFLYKYILIESLLFFYLFSIFFGELARSLNLSSPSLTLLPHFHFLLILDGRFKVVLYITDFTVSIANEALYCF